MDREGREREGEIHGNSLYIIIVGRPISEGNIGNISWRKWHNLKQMYNKIKPHLSLLCVLFMEIVLIKKNRPEKCEICLRRNGFYGR